jgi:integrase/recombinase XerD
MRQRARQSVDLRHHQGVATLYRSYRVRELRPGAEPARGFLLIDGFTTRRRQGIALTAQIFVFCRDAGISDEGHTPLRRPIDFLTPVEVAALLAAPDLNTLCGRRDRALLLLAVQTGLRASELLSLRCQDIVLGPGAHVRCHGKGRKVRNTPLRKETITVLRGWLQELHCQPSDPAFSTTSGTALSHDGLQYFLTKHLAVAHSHCPSLAGKRVTPHVLRHTLAMDLLHNGVDRSVIALWLGHESVETTSIYLQADMKLKEEALAKATPADVRPSRYHPDDHVLAFLRSL